MAEYRLRVRDAQHSLIDEVVRYRSLKYARVLNDVGGFELQVGWQSPSATNLAEMNFVEVLRDGQEEFYGVILGREYAFGQDAPQDEVLTVRGLHVNCFLGWREIVPPTGQAYDERSGPADNIMKGYVRDHIGPNAPSARRYQYLSVATDTSDAPSKVYRGRYPEPLLDVLQSLSVAGSVDFDCVRVSGGFEFRTYWPQMGLDKTRDNGVRSPVVFAKERGNVRSGRYRRDGTGVVNYVYVLGQGEGADRTVIEREDAASVAAWLRRELAIDARHLDVTDKLQQRGDEELAKRVLTQSIELDVASVPNCQYGRDWDLGDLVTGQVAGVTFDAKITAVTVKLEAGKPEQIAALIQGG